MKKNEYIKGLSLVTGCQFQAVAFLNQGLQGSVPIQLDRPSLARFQMVPRNKTGTNMGTDWRLSH